MCFTGKDSHGSTLCAGLGCRDPSAMSMNQQCTFNHRVFVNRNIQSRVLVGRGRCCGRRLQWIHLCLHPCVLGAFPGHGGCEQASAMGLFFHGTGSKPHWVLCSVSPKATARCFHAILSCLQWKPRLQEFQVPGVLCSSQLAGPALGICRYPMIPWHMSLSQSGSSASSVENPAVESPVPRLSSEVPGEKHNCHL